MASGAYATCNVDLARARKVPIRKTFHFVKALVLISSCIALINVSDAGQLLTGFPAPRIVQTQNSIFDAVIFWDATPYVEKFAALDTSPMDALKAMKYEAVKIFIAHAPALARQAHHLRVIVFFARTGAISARYQTATIEGVETVLTLDGVLHRNMRFAKGWESDAERGTLPAGIKLQVMSDALKQPK